MSNAPTVPQKLTAASQPCVCCRARKHDGIPDADLEGYVCRSCKRQLRVVEDFMKKQGFTGCSPDPK
jgi:hypothetical protein